MEKTFEERLREAADKAKTRVEYDRAVDEIIEEMKQTAEWLQRGSIPRPPAKNKKSRLKNEE